MVFTGWLHLLELRSCLSLRQILFGTGACPLGFVVLIFLPVQCRPTSPVPLSPSSVLPLIQADSSPHQRSPNRVLCYG